MEYSLSGLKFYFTVTISIFLFVLISTSIAISQVTGENKESPVFKDSNPFAHESTLLHQAPQFDKIHDYDYQPALEEGMRIGLEEINRIALNPAHRRHSTTLSLLWKNPAYCSLASLTFSFLCSARTPMK